MRIILIIALAFLSSSALAKHAKIDVLIDAQGCPSAAEPDEPCDGDENVCFSKGEAHKITWKYKDKDKSGKDFSIVMKDADDTVIFLNGCDKKAKKFTCDLRNTAATGSYAYSIVVDETCQHDPRIIINDN